MSVKLVGAPPKIQVFGKRIEGVVSETWEKNTPPWKKVPPPCELSSTAACFYGPLPRRKWVLRKNFYERRDFFYVLRDIFYVASPFSRPRPAGNGCCEMGVG